MFVVEVVEVVWQRVVAYPDASSCAVVSEFGLIDALLMWGYDFR